MADNVIETLDVDKILPPARTFTLAGETVDVSALPSKVVLEIIKSKTSFEKDGDAAFDMLISKTEEICQRTNKKITRAWLLENTTIQQLIAIIEFILEPLKAAAETKGKQGKASVPKNV